jgi:SAM-dependent methyltransferase
MLAPRKTLWSTPPSAVTHLRRWICLKPNDCVCDIGCGDGRVLLQWAEQESKQLVQEVSVAAAADTTDTTDTTDTDTESPILSFIGIDIDEERIQLSQAALKLARKEGRIHPNISVTFYCGNALESLHLLGRANIFFLYLIPRGLKIIKPLLLQHKQEQLDNQQQLQVVTYMAKLQGETQVDRALCQVDHQPGAEWPLYLYHL